MKHKITINGREDTAELKKYYSLKKPMYEVDETVSFSVHTATDTDYKVTSTQTSIRCEKYEPGGISTYSFIMPDTDVEIDISAQNSMVNPFMNGAPMPGIGMNMMAMGMMGMNSPMITESVINSDSNSWEGKPKFCAECGAPTKDSNKFCRECGAPLLPKK